MSFISNLRDTTEGQENVDTSASMLSEEGSEPSSTSFAEEECSPEECSPEANILIISFLEVLLLISRRIIVFCSGRTYGSSKIFIPSSLKVISYVFLWKLKLTPKNELSRAVRGKNQSEEIMSKNKKQNFTKIEEWSNIF